MRFKKSVYLAFVFLITTHWAIPLHADPETEPMTTLLERSNGGDKFKIPTFQNNLECQSAITKARTAKFERGGAATIGGVLSMLLVVRQMTVSQEAITREAAALKSTIKVAGNNVVTDKVLVRDMASLMQSKEASLAKLAKEVEALKKYTFNDPKLEGFRRWLIEETDKVCTSKRSLDFWKLKADAGEITEKVLQEEGEAAAKANLSLADLNILKKGLGTELLEKTGAMAAAEGAEVAGRTAGGGLLSSSVGYIYRALFGPVAFVLWEGLVHPQQTDATDTLYYTKGKDTSIFNSNIPVEKICELAFNPSSKESKYLKSEIEYKTALASHIDEKSSGVTATNQVPDAGSKAVGH